MRARAEIVFPNNIRDLRLRRGMTQAQVGRMMDPPIGESAVSKMESGERRLTNLQLASLAAILGCPPEEIPVVSGRDPAEGVRRWRQAQQEVVGSSIASGAAAAGYVLAQLRKKHGKTMQQVANAIGMTLSVYHRMEMASRMIQADEIEKVAILARGRILPATCTVAEEFHEKAFALCALDIARDPVASIAASRGKIGAAHGLRLRRETARQFVCVTHDMIAYLHVMIEGLQGMP